MSNMRRTTQRATWPMQNLVNEWTTWQTDQYTKSTLGSVQSLRWTFEWILSTTEHYRIPPYPACSSMQRNVHDASSISCPTQTHLHNHNHKLIYLSLIFGRPVSFANQKDRWVSLEQECGEATERSAHDGLADSTHFPKLLYHPKLRR